LPSCSKSPSYSLSGYPKPMQSSSPISLTPRANEAQKDEDSSRWTIHQRFQKILDGPGGRERVLAGAQGLFRPFRDRAG
jgi:hypothetical protein